MAGSRQFVYRYEGDPKSEETEQDLLGLIPVPEKDDVIERNGKKWKVVAVNTEQLLSNPPAIPVHRIFLTKSD
jgi:hypothetical protein